MLHSDFSRIDHLIFGASELETGIELIRQKLGIRPTNGGRHPDFGTHNALFKIGAHTYFEIIAPDPGSAYLHPELWMGLDQLEDPALIWWAVKADDLENTLAGAHRVGWDLGNPFPGSRRMEDGTLLRWQLTDPFRVQEQGILPFLINWSDSPHPTTRMPEVNCKLVELQLLHPQPDRISRYLAAINLELPVKGHPVPKIRAGFATEAGRIYL